MIRCGVSIFLTDDSIGPADVARAVEERGLDSIFVPEHTHIPTSRKTPWAGGPELPKHYIRTLDPFVALGVAAAVTSRITLATGVTLVPERDPIVLAKEVATLDHVSNGRVILGVGAGWNREEMENHGVEFGARWKITRERVLAMKTIWREEAAEFHGEYVDFDPIWSWPKPVQAGGPPVWLGSKSRWVPDRVADYGDGWIPIHGRDGEAAIGQLREACARRGRDFDDITLGVFGCPPKEEEARTLIAQGYRHLVFLLPSAGRDTVLPKLDRLAALAARLRD